MMKSVIHAQLKVIADTLRQDSYHDSVALRVSLNELRNAVLELSQPEAKVMLAKVIPATTPKTEKDQCQHICEQLLAALDPL
jgi:hypothetical protein